MIKKIYIPLILLYCFISHDSFAQNERNYPWLDYNSIKELYCIKDIPVKQDFVLKIYEKNTFQDWIQKLPVKIHDDYVNLYDGTLKANQRAHYKIINIDVGNNDLQQCADAIIRLYAEYLFSQRKYNSISFHFTSGDKASFESWINGMRPVIKGNKVSWKKSADYDLSYKNFRKYLNIIFTYAGSYSLAKELNTVNDVNDIEVGDVFIQGGFPGHGVIVVSLSVNNNNNKKMFLLAQSYMPAQEIHILKNIENKTISPWFEVNGSEKLITPEWTFNWTDIKRFVIK